ncbi:hypothetical protein W02_07180 [Nitrospira sp. KM1]|nr:hypothetical protein W02_07180 [Nitrospira sp. KM1]
MITGQYGRRRIRFAIRVSVTCGVKLKVLAAVGVPEITPDNVPIGSIPVGIFLEARLQRIYGPTVIVTV